MVRSFIIRYRLQSSLPKDARKHYSLIMDPAAGNVSVGVDTPQLNLSNLLHSASEHYLGMGFLINIKNDLLSEPWMELESIGIHPSYTGIRKRFTVGYDLRVESVGLKCTWTAFVVLSLAVGVDPYRGGLLDLKRNISTNFREIILKSSDDMPIINVRKQESRVLARVVRGRFTYSLFTGLAWVGGMIEAHGRDVHFVHFGLPTIGRGLDNVGFSNSHTTHRLHIHRKNDTWPTQATARALVWVLYAETYYHEPIRDLMIRSNRVLPVTQEILRIREDILQELRLVENLEGSLNDIFLREISLVRTILTALGHEWDTRGEDKRKSRPFTDEPPGYVDIWGMLQDNYTFKALKDNYHPIPTLRSRSDADLAQLTTPMAILARVIIAVSSIQKWPREEWSVEMDGSFKIPADPMDELLDGYGLTAEHRFTDDDRESIYFE